MATVRYSNKQAAKRVGRVDRDMLDATTEAAIEQQRLKDEEDGEFDLKNARVVVAPDYVSSVRKKLGMTQSEFADRFHLSRRTVQEWEQGRAVPDQPSIVLLRVIAHAPKVVEKALNNATISRSGLGFGLARGRQSKTTSVVAKGKR